MQWAFLAAGTIGVVELFLRLPIPDRVQHLRVVVRKVLRITGAKFVSDHWKQRALFAYSGKLLADSLGLFALLLVALSPLAVLCAIGMWTQIALLPLLMDFRGVLASLFTAGVYLTLRRGFRYV